MSRNRFLLGLALIGVVFLAVASSRYSPEWFGSSHDDTLYFSAAKSIADGNGYRIASLPGEPPQSKYPVLYPALLSLVWRVGPAFPGNLAWAWTLNLLLGLVVLLGAAAVARQLGAGRGETLAIVALVAVSPHFVYWSNHLVSDILFAALALGGVALAQRELDRAAAEVRWASWIGAVVLIGLACATRTVGVAFVAAVVLAALFRRRPALAAAALAALAPIVLRLDGRQSDAALAAKADAFPGFAQNLTYYTDYVGHWRESVPSLDILTAQVSFALTELLKHPAVAVFQIPATGFVSFPVAVLAIALTVGIVAGIVARAKKNGLHVIHWAALLYMPIVLLWNYLLMGRFWLPFLVLLFSGATHELIRIAGMTRENWKKSPAADRVVIAPFAAAILALVAFAGHRALLRSPAGLAAAEQTRVDLLDSKREAFRWLAANSDHSDAIVSSDDALLYLYVGRQGMRPFAPLTDSFFAQSQERLDRDLAGMADTALALEARYWVVSPDDFEMTHAPEEIRESQERQLERLPVVFTSNDGKVRVHDVSGGAGLGAELSTRMGQEGETVR